MVPGPQRPGSKMPPMCPWGKDACGGTGGCVLPTVPHRVPAEPTPGGAEEAAPGVLAAQEYPAPSRALSHSASTQATSRPSVPPPSSPESTALLSMATAHSCCVSMPAMGLAASHLPESHLHWLRLAPNFY